MRRRRLPTRAPGPKAPARPRPATYRSPTRRIADPTRTGFRPTALAIAAVLLTPALFLPATSADADIFHPPRETVPMFNITFGEAGVADDLNEPGRYGLEYRFRDRGRFRLIPAVGVSASETGATFFYTDLRRELWLSPRVMLIPSFGLGWFQESDELRLGHDLQFRSGIEVAYRFAGEYRVGVALFHLSNGGISDLNPGTESVVVSLCIPLRRG